LTRNAEGCCRFRTHGISSRSQDRVGSNYP
jgi:hypothetical protein